MALENNFIAGLDPSPLGVISAAQLLQMVNEALPSTKRGIVYYSAVAPDIISNPELIKYIWLDPSNQPMIPKVYNTTTAVWDYITLPDLSILGNKIADGTITPIKLQPGGAYQLMRTDPTGSFVEWWTQVFATNSIDIVSLGMGSGAAGDFLRIKPDGSGVEWFTFKISDYLVIGAVPLASIEISGVAGDVIAVDPTGTFLYYTDILSLIANGAFPIAKISPGNPNSYLRTNPLGTGVVWDNTTTPVVTHGREILTPASVSPWVVPAGIYTIDVEVVGPGGGGRNIQANGNSGGSGGGYSRKILNVIPGQNINFVVGAGGATGNPGSPGNANSVFNATIIGEAGLGGTLATIAGGSFSGGDFGAEGYKGGTTAVSASEIVSGSLPDYRYMAFTGGRSGHPLSRGGGITTAPTFGGGGSSAQNSAGAAVGAAAQNGADGIIIITY